MPTWQEVMQIEIAKTEYDNKSNSQVAGMLNVDGPPGEFVPKKSIDPRRAFGKVVPSELDALDAKSRSILSIVLALDPLVVNQNLKDDFSIIFGPASVTTARMEAFMKTVATLFEALLGSQSRFSVRHHHVAEVRAMP